MFHPLIALGFGHYFFAITLTLLSLFLILLVLVQRGRGGGLAGAFGGMGGQSAFGTKAGDTFTKITIVVALIWILLSMASVRLLGNNAGAFGRATAPDQPQVMPGSNEPPESPLDGQGAPPTGTLGDLPTGGGDTPDSSTPASDDASSEQP